MKEICEEQLKRKRIQNYMWIFFPIIVIGGLKWPYLGYGVLAIMIIFIILALSKGRQWCGWLCPRGSFLERVFVKVSLNRKAPSFLKEGFLRWAIFVGLLGFMVFRLIKTGGNPVKIGAVFILMCAISSVVAFALGLIFKPRTWCSFCPMGTLQGLLGPNKNMVFVSDACIDCGACAKVCPIGTSPADFKDAGRVASIDCLRCRECVAKCPLGALNC